MDPDILSDLSFSDQDSSMERSMRVRESRGLQPHLPQMDSRDRTAFYLMRLFHRLQACPLSYTSFINKAILQKVIQFSLDRRKSSRKRRKTNDIRKEIEGVS